MKQAFLFYHQKCISAIKFVAECIIQKGLSELEVRKLILIRLENDHNEIIQNLLNHSAETAVFIFIAEYFFQFLYSTLNFP